MENLFGLTQAQKDLLNSIENMQIKQKTARKKAKRKQNDDDENNELEESSLTDHHLSDELQHSINHFFDSFEEATSPTILSTSVRNRT